MKIFIFAALLCLTCITLFTQPNSQSNNYGTIFRFELSNAPFPDAERENGHEYNNVHYPKEMHYNDSTVLVFLPNYLDFENAIDAVVYFHGWWNNVDSVLSQFKLIEQFFGSGRNAILIMPEGPKNAADSFGGKLEEAGRFKLFIDEVIKNLDAVQEQPLKIRNITLAGHSGAYRVMAYILMRGGMTDQISEVFLFDGLYADVEKYSYWLDHFAGRFINIYTPKGGTKRESENLMECLTAWGLSFTHIVGDDFNDSQLQDDRIIFIESQLGHNEVISTRYQFRKFLETSFTK
jgi:hypothetical protein